MNQLERTALEMRHNFAQWAHIKGNWVMLLCAIICALCAVYWANKYSNIKAEFEECIPSTVEQYKVYICNKDDK